MFLHLYRLVHRVVYVHHAHTVAQLVHFSGRCVMRYDRKYVYY